MQVYLRFLREPGKLQEAFAKDGWQLEREKGESLLARHPDVSDEGAARSRLHRLGLLTSGSLCIEFRGIRDVNPSRRWE